MIVSAGAESRGTVVTTGRTPWEARTEVGAVMRVVYAVEAARGVTIAVNQTLLFDVVAELGTFESQCIVPKYK